MGGAIVLGDESQDNELPAHQVTLSSYSIGKTEVTQELWIAVMGSNPSWFTSYLNRPVEMVSWDDCQEFITMLNQMTGMHFRLPTEAEWEFAARGGKESKYYRFAGSNTVDDVAWYNENAYYVGSSSLDYGTHSVATKAPNELGLYDMSGNVWEWCQDWYGSYSIVAQTNPTGPATGSYRVLRGGSWKDDNWSCRVVRRVSYLPAYEFNDYGLRLVL
jgi:formylglycine-generating enzyme required for sulfatase activity